MIDKEIRKKKVLLIGDSIRMGYCEAVKAALADVADVFYPEENCRNTQYVICSLYRWIKDCDAENIDVVHFNCGHWDIAHYNNEPLSLTDMKTYGQNIVRIIYHIRKFFPKAKIYFATTTPMHPYKKDVSNPRTNNEIRQYNEVGVRAAKSEAVEVNDLFTLMEEKADSFYLDYCHYTDEGYLILAKAVSDFIRDRL